MSTHRRHLSVVTDPKINLDAQMREVSRLMSDVVSLREQIAQAELAAKIYRTLIQREDKDSKRGKRVGESWNSDKTVEVVARGASH